MPRTDEALRKQITELATMCGWDVFHFPAMPVKYPGQPLRWMTPGRAGFPDLLMLRERVLVVEVKGDTATARKAKPHQRRILDAFRIAGCKAVTWTPKDWEDGTVAAELARHNRPRPSLLEAADVAA